VRFLFGKARITPLKPLTTSKLELLATLLGARAAKSTRKLLNLTECPTYL